MASLKEHDIEAPASTELDLAAALAPQATQAKAKARSVMAHQLLADQPTSLAAMSQGERARVVVSAVLVDDGSTEVISRVGDLQWNLWPFVTTPNTPKSKKIIQWKAIPEPYRQAIQNVVYAYWKRGRPGWSAPSVASLDIAIKGLAAFCSYAQARGLKSLADAQPIHITNFVQEQREAGHLPSTLAQKFAAVELLHHFRAEHPGTLVRHPWPESSASDMAGFTGRASNDARKVGLTPLIPAEVAQRLFLYAESVLAQADHILGERDAGARSAWKDPGVTALRDACFYLIGVLTGMRSSEISSIAVGAGRSEDRGGFVFHWLTSVDHKTKKGAVDYLMPSMGHKLLSIMERWSRPHRDRLEQQISALERRDGKPTAKELQWLAGARANRDLLFLGNGPSGITPVSGTHWVTILKRFAARAGVDWDVAPHQLRRLYAYTFVRHRLGDMLFLKEQFKHSSINMTQLYASNPRLDLALYDDILTEMLRYKAEVVSTWLEKDEPLAGGAADRVKALRAHDFPDRKALVLESSKRVLIQSNGHAWCLAQDEGCGGSGIYEKGRCGSCSSGLIDSRFIPIWKEAYRHHKVLLSEAQDWGEGAVKRVSADLKQAAKMLRDLGINPDEEGDGQTATH
jgi:site-specific recombinase XerD